MIALDNGSLRRARRLRSVRQAIDAYLASPDQGHISSICWQERKRLLEMFAAELGDLRLSHCRVGHLERWLAAHPCWSSDWTRMRVAHTIGRAFNYLAHLGEIRGNPFSGFHARQGPRGRPLERHEFQALLRCSDACFRRVLVFLRYTGARPGELRGLEWSMLRPQRSCAVLSAHKTAHTRRDRAPRTLMLHPIVVKLLICIRRRQLPLTRWVFLNSKGRPWTRSALVLRMYRLRQRAGIAADCKLYGNRHAFATNAALAGVDIATLATLLGHTTMEMAAYYVRLAGQDDHLQQALQKAVAAGS